MGEDIRSTPTGEKKGIGDLLFRPKSGIKLISELRNYVQILHVITPSEGITPEEITYERFKLPKSHMRKNLPLIIHHKKAPYFLISALTDMLKNYVSVIAVYDEDLKEGIVSSSYKRKYQRGDRIEIEPMLVWD